MRVDVWRVCVYVTSDRKTSFDCEPVTGCKRNMMRMKFWRRKSLPVICVLNVVFPDAVSCRVCVVSESRAAGCFDVVNADTSSDS